MKGSDQLPEVFVKHFLGTGFFEETLKAIPLFVIAIASMYMPAAMRSKYGIEEPLDGILLGAASAGGFAFWETIGQYISQELVSDWKSTVAVGLFHVNNDPASINAWLAKNAKQMANIVHLGRDLVGWQPGLALLIPRSLGEAFGHMAYAGCFGYFIGLAVMKPQQKWRILAIGLVSSSLLHALWDSLADSRMELAIVAVLSYAVLAAGILKAREISPNRAALMPSIFIGSLSPSPSVVAAYAGGGCGFRWLGSGGGGECASSAEAEGCAGTESAAGRDCEPAGWNEVSGDRAGAAVDGAPGSGAGCGVYGGIGGGGY